MHEAASFYARRRATRQLPISYEDTRGTPLPTPPSFITALFSSGWTAYNFAMRQYEIGYVWQKSSLILAIKVLEATAPTSYLCSIEAFEDLLSA